MRPHGILIPILATALMATLAVFSANAAAQTVTPADEAQAREQARLNAITDRYLTPVKVEMTTKVDTKNAVAGQQVSAKTLAEVRLADGTALPNGTRLMGHIVQVRPGGPGGNAILTLTFDRAEVKSGASLPVRSVIRAVAPAATAQSSRDIMTQLPSATGTRPPSNDPTDPGSTSDGLGEGVPIVAAPGSRGTGSRAPGSPNNTGTAPGVPPGGQAGSTRPTLGGSVPIIRESGGGLGLPGEAVTATPNRKVEQAGETLSGAPRPTGLPGVLLWASPTASGTLTSMGQNVSLQSGLQMTLGVIAR